MANVKLSLLRERAGSNVVTFVFAPDDVLTPSDHSCSSTAKDRVISRPPADYLDYYQMASTAGEACPPLSVALNFNGSFKRMVE